MVSLMPDIDDNSLYPIGEAARILGVHRHSLRKYAEKNLISSSVHHGNGRRMFAGAALKKFWMNCFR